MNIRFHAPVMTKDGVQLGLAQSMYRAEPEDGLEVKPYLSYLKVFDFNSGDDYYIPMEFVTESSEDVSLSLSQKQILAKSMSAMPRSVAYGSAEIVHLEN